MNTPHMYQTGQESRFCGEPVKRRREIAIRRLFCLCTYLYLVHIFLRYISLMIHSEQYIARQFQACDWKCLSPSPWRWAGSWGSLQAGFLCCSQCRQDSQLCDISVRPVTEPVAADATADRHVGRSGCRRRQIRHQRRRRTTPIAAKPLTGSRPLPDRRVAAVDRPSQPPRAH